MNTALALEIYRGLWVVESSRVDALKNVLRDARTPGVIYNPDDKANTFSFFGLESKATISAKGNASASKEKKVAVTNVNGVITKAGGASSWGMMELSADMVDADNDPDVIGHLVQVDSPGGSEAGMKYMQETMRGLTKPIVTLVTRQGMAASGGWGILSEGSYVMAESGDAEIGCHGVMWSVSGVPNGQKDANGEVNFVVVSSTSPNKNDAPLAAINNNDTSLMQAEVDKKHAAFRASSKAARPNVKDEQMTGKLYPASEVVGTMIDAIGSKADAINKILELSDTNSTFKANSNNQSTTAMTAEEIKAKFPDAHAAIFGAGVTAGTQSGVDAEQERVKSWQVYAAVDAEAVNKGIASGKAISQSETHAFLLKATSKNTLDALNKDSNVTVVPPAAGSLPEATPEVVAKQKEVSDLFALATFNKN